MGNMNVISVSDSYTMFACTLSIPGSCVRNRLKQRWMQLWRCFPFPPSLTTLGLQTFLISRRTKSSHKFHMLSEFHLMFVSWIRENWENTTFSSCFSTIFFGKHPGRSAFIGVSHAIHIISSRLCISHKRSTQYGLNHLVRWIKCWSKNWMVGSIPIGSMVLVYMLTWLGYINGKCYHIYQHHGSYGIARGMTSLIIMRGSSQPWSWLPEGKSPKNLRWL